MNQSDDFYEELLKIFGPKGLKDPDRDNKRSKQTNKQCFKALMDAFENCKIPVIDIKDCDKKCSEITFQIHGNRNSVAMFRIWGGHVVDIWLGKSNSDSGGRALQIAVYEDNNNSKDVRSVLNLHKRFMHSGRLKILRNYKR